jgi:L-lactate dehydrogenase complex protein LldE
MHQQKTVALFIPCIVDQVYPEIGLAMARVLEFLGYKVSYDAHQTCCGQPAFNAGHRREAKKIARRFLHVFKDSENIVGPSGSCTAMVKNYYPILFKDDKLEEIAENVGRNIFEFSQFLKHEKQIDQISARYEGKVGFHNSCHSYRELNILSEPLSIFQQIDQLEVVQPEGEPVCCGFGGLFSFKYDEISATIAKTRLEMFMHLDVKTVITNDPGCLMHMRQEAIDRKSGIEILHLAEFLVKLLNL